MVGYKKKYQKVISELVEKSFPELKNENICIEEKRTLNWRARVVYSFLGMKIIVSHQLRKFDKKTIQRILIHELSHLSIFKKWGVILTNLNYIYYCFSRRYRVAIERDANLLMIKKGYGKLVLSAMKENIKRGLSYPLTEREIKAYAKNMGKW